MAKILVLNNISKSGLEPLKNHKLGDDIKDPYAIVVRSAKVNTDDHPTLIAVGRAGAGVDNITVEEATKKGIAVFNTPGANANAVAELVFIMLGVYARCIDQAQSFLKELDWSNPVEALKKMEKNKARFKGFELSGKTLSVLGLGKIGVLVANAGIKNGMEVIGYDPFLTEENKQQLDPRVKIIEGLEEAISGANIVSVHIPLNGKTRHIIGKEQIAQMLQGVLINYSRDGICDDAAVLEALDKGTLAAYITDFPTKELVGHKKVLCTPHLGASTEESEENCALMISRQIKNYIDYGVVNNSVNFPNLEAFPDSSIRSRLVVISKDAPNMIASITGVLGGFGVNIKTLHNDSRSQISYNLVDIEVNIDSALADEIRQIPDVLRVRLLRL